MRSRREVTVQQTSWHAKAPSLCIAQENSHAFSGTSQFGKPPQFSLGGFSQRYFRRVPSSCHSPTFPETALHSTHAPWGALPSGYFWPAPSVRRSRNHAPERLGWLPENPDVVNLDLSSCFSSNGLGSRWPPSDLSDCVGSGPLVSNS